MYRITDDLSKRINVLKLLLIIMVVFIHSSPDMTAYIGSAGLTVSQTSFHCFTYIISQSVSRAAVPLFFLISSVLLYSKDFKWIPNMHKKCRTVLLPYIIWNTYWILFCYAAQTIPVIMSYFPRESYYVRQFRFMDWISAYTYLNGNYPFLYTLWFLRDLFILNVFALLIRKIVDKQPVAVLVSITFLWLSNISIPYLDSQSVVFFVLGYYIVKYKIDIKRADAMNWVALTMLYAVSVILDYAFSNSCPVIHRISVCIGIIFFIKLSGVLINIKIGDKILYLADYTFIIYVYHEMNLSILRKIITLVLPQTALLQWAEFLLIPFVITAGCILFGMIFKKVFPGIYLLSTGSR